MSFDDGVSEEFKSQFAAWMRLEPRCRSDNIGEGLQARTADPLWYLTRQWQLGEFIGEDAASPLEVNVRYSKQTLNNVRLGQDENTIAYPNSPLEQIVEAEKPEVTWRTRIQMGQQFEFLARQILQSEAQDLLQGYRTQFSLIDPRQLHGGDQIWLNLDYKSRHYIEYMIGRVVDGYQIHLEIEQNNLQAPGGISGPFDQVVRQFQDWYQRVIFRSDSSQSRAWQKRQLDYAFEINSPLPGQASGERTHLVAPNYRNGNLDWYTSYIEQTSENAWFQSKTLKFIPTLINATGTSPRWWEMEDSNTNFGNLDTDKTDLAKLLFMEFMLIYADDWYSIPLPGRTDTLMRIDDLRVKDSFGETHVITSARQNIIDEIDVTGGDPDSPLLRWQAFSLTKSENLETEYLEVIDRLKHTSLTTAQRQEAENRLTEIRNAGDLLYIPAVVNFREESKPIEEVKFVRDENANMVWGIESMVLNKAGFSRSGRDAHDEQETRLIEYQMELLQTQLLDIEQQLLTGVTDELLEQARTLIQALKALRNNGASTRSSTAPQFRLASIVPHNWIPFMPSNSQAYGMRPNRSVKLRRAQMLRNHDDDYPTPIQAKTKLLEMTDDPLLWLEEEAVTRAGLRVQLTNQRVRWIDGKTYVWQGRKILTGAGESNSGLKYDFIE